MSYIDEQRARIELILDNMADALNLTNDELRHIIDSWLNRQYEILCEQKYAPCFIEWEDVCCAKCQYWRPSKDIQHLGVCGRHSPRHGLENLSRARWNGEENWCGDFYPKGGKFVRDI